MRYLLLCLPLMIVGCNSQPNFQPDLNKSVSEATHETKPLFDVGYSDLNGDGLKDALVLLKGSDWCGSGGCSFMVFENLGSHYKLMSQSSITSPPISVANSETNGWKNLIVWTSNIGSVLMKFNGKTYPYNPSLEPIASQSQQLGSQLILKN
ncbi:hypothetical protein [Photobacterium kishitanii]|uniref:hypothetical protein n=1 Tax=Photobacterium kishitanii TaxID=318456 RepID=UPI00273983A4|nr:hypothetical protein [Photobacterium kishitanii]